MDEKVANIWTNNFESTLSALKSFSQWLILLNLSITLNYITEYLQWNKQKALLSRYETALHQPWQPLQSFYEESMDSLAVYDQQVAEPLIKLSYSVDRHGTVPDSIQYVRKNLAAYGANLTSISTAQENGTPFDELNKQQMMSLIGLIRFSDSSRMDSLRQRLQAVVELAGPAIGIKGPGSGDEGPAGEVAAFQDFITQSGLRFRDYRTFVRETLKDSLDSVQNYLDSNAFESLNTINANKTQAFDKIKEFESGSSIGIPLTSVNVSLTQFVIVAGIINLGIIFYFTVLFHRTRALWTKCAGSPGGVAGVGADPGDPTQELAAAYFFNWTWGIRRMPVFVLCFSLFMAYIAVISLVFSFMIYSISRRFPVSSLYLIGLFALLNVVAAAWVSVRYYRFKEKTLMASKPPIT
jgi:hypothetical protein